MKLCEIVTLMYQTNSLQREITRLLDENCSNIDGELRIKLGIAESSLFKITKLLKGKLNEYP